MAFLMSKLAFWETTVLMYLSAYVVTPSRAAMTMRLKLNTSSMP